MVDLCPPDLAEHVHPRQHVEPRPPAPVKTTLSTSWGLEDHTVQVLSEWKHVFGNVDSGNIILNPLGNYDYQNIQVYMVDIYLFSN